MNSIVDISIWKLLISMTAMVLPTAFFLYYRVKVVNSVLIGTVRMIIQLSLMALYLEWIFELNNAVINAAWVLIMIFVGVFTSIKRIGIRWKYFVLPFFISGFTTVLIIDAFFLGFVLNLDYFFDARYFIPISGMILGNAINHNIIGLNTYFRDFQSKSELYYFLLTNTGSSKIALRPFIGNAIKQAMNPMIATLTVIGLISLPGMMTGQILGGSSPSTAIHYQIMIMIAIFVGCSINIFLSIILSNKFIFDKYGVFRENLMKNS